MRVEFRLIDAFVTERPFSGNPAGVVLLDHAVDAAWMQAVAAEMNQAETAFVSPAGESWSLRWFTPTVEVDLCGHATLAAAHALWLSGVHDPALTFHTKSGSLLAVRIDESRYQLDFPSEAPEPATHLALEVLFEDLRFVGQNRMDWFVELGDAEQVRRFVPDFAIIGQLGKRGLIVTAAGTGDTHVVSRFFAPLSGVNEDHATGSAHCALAPYWSEILGQAILSCYQASSRGAQIETELRGDRVLLRGTVREVLSGQLG